MSLTKECQLTFNMKKKINTRTQDVQKMYQEKKRNKDLPLGEYILR